MLQYSLEPLDKCWHEMNLLFQDHVDEVERLFVGERADVDEKIYRELDRQNKLRVFTVRDERRFLVGYQVFTLSMSAHYKSILQAHQDVLYIKKENRGNGAAFINWCDEMLGHEGVQLIIQDIRASNNFGEMLTVKCGYKPFALLYAKRLVKKDDRLT